MIVGSLVTWTIHGTSITGRLAYVNGSTARVEANGSTHEVDKTALRVIRVCLYCGKPLTDKKKIRKFCSLPHSQAYRRKNVCSGCGKPLSHGRSDTKTCRACRDAADRKANDDLIFAGIIRYKQAHEGASPDDLWLAKNIFCSRFTIREVLIRLQKAGRIRVETTGAKRFIFVTGARWVYEEP